MPARKRRLGLNAQAPMFVEAEIRRLRDAAARAGELLDRLEGARAQAAADPGADAAAAASPARPTGKGWGWWPFGRKSDPATDRAAVFRAELEAAVRGRPDASAEEAEKAAGKAQQSARKVGTAA
jgi:hypothetical protein